VVETADSGQLLPSDAVAKCLIVWEPANDGCTRVPCRDMWRMIVDVTHPDQQSFDS
jgi:hypothetical protein